MRDLLIHEATFARVEDRLKPFRAAISPLTVSDSAEIGRPWGEPGAEAQSLIAFGNVDVWFGGGVRLFMKTALSAPRLEWFQSSAAGLENPVLQQFGAKAETYTSSHVQSDAIADWVLWAGYDFFGEGAKRRAAQEAREWARVHFREMATTHWMIVGFGHIGEAVARRLKALGARVTGVRRSGGTSPYANAVITPAELMAHLGKADAVLLCAPHTAETESLADKAFFASMKPDSLFLNVGRGALVDEAALLAALDAGRPAHAALDVVREEPLATDSPIWSHRAITLTAHTSAFTAASHARNDQLFIDNLGRFLGGERLYNIVQKSEFAA